MTQLKLLFLGAMLGFTLSHIGFTSWDEVHAMFTFSDVRMFLAFAVGVSLLTLAFTVIQKTSSPAWSPRPIHRGTIAGGVLFGMGWALSGACPGVTLAQLGEGRFYALFSIAGVVLGNLLYGAFLERRLGTANVTAKATS
jgi:uncharacterized membrane protein YedE/YeeE